MIEVTYAGDAPGYAPWGGTSGSAAGRPSSAARSSARSSATGCSRSPRGDGIRSRSRPARRRTATPTTCSSSATGSPAGSSRSRSLHALRRRDRAAVRHRRRVAADRGVRPVARPPRRRSCADRLTAAVAGGRYAGTMTRSVIVSAVRTPFGRLGGGLAGAPGDRARRRSRSGPALERAGVDPGRGRLRRDGPGAPGRRRAGAGATGGRSARESRRRCPPTRSTRSAPRRSGRSSWPT